MGFRFRKSIHAGPFRINFSKSGIGYSIGEKGYRYTKKANGSTRSTISIPGTGISYVKENTKKAGSTMKQTAKHTSSLSSSSSQQERHVETFTPTNISADTIKKLARLNPEWRLSDTEILANGEVGQKIYQCKFITSPVRFVPESGGLDNSEMLAIYVADQKLGYVGSDIHNRISKILNYCNVKRISCILYGGLYKTINEDFTISTHKSGFTISIRITYFTKSSNSSPPAKHKKPEHNSAKQVTTTELLLCLLLGWAGGHKFYRKKVGIGIVYLLTFGLFLIGWWGDLLLLFINYIKKRVPHQENPQRHLPIFSLPFWFLAWARATGTIIQPQQKCPMNQFPNHLK